MTLYNCSACGSVHDSSGPACDQVTVRTIGIGSQHPDLRALIDLKEAVMEWFRNDDEFFRLLRDLEAPGNRELWREANDRIGPLYDRMLVLARRWHPLPNIS